MEIWDLLEKKLGDWEDGDEGSEKSAKGEELFPKPDLVFACQRILEGENLGEVVELVGGGDQAVGLEGVQDGFVMDDAKISGGAVTVVVVDLDAS
jgi:predicted HAD superfamily phosphohydrolase